jgi:hypothetical protein
MVVICSSHPRTMLWKGVSYASWLVLILQNGSSKKLVRPNLQGWVWKRCNFDVVYNHIIGHGRLNHQLLSNEPLLDCASHLWSYFPQHQATVSLWLDIVHDYDTFVTPIHMDLFPIPQIRPKK